MNKAFLFFCLMIMIFPFQNTAHPYEKLSKYSGKLESAGLLFPSTYTNIWVTIRKGFRNNRVTNIISNIAALDKASGVIESVNQSSFADSAFTIDSNLAIVQYHVAFKDTNLIEMIKMDHESITNLLKDKKLVISKFKNGKLDKTSEVSYDGDTIDGQGLAYILQGFIARGIHQNFNCDILFGSEFKVNVDIRMIGNAALKNYTNLYQFPEPLLAPEILNSKVVLFEMAATGLIGMAYPHKYYYAFDSSYPYALKAYWGGNPDPKETEFQYKIN